MTHPIIDNQHLLNRFLRDEDRSRLLQQWEQMAWNPNLPLPARQKALRLLWGLPIAVNEPSSQSVDPWLPDVA